MSDVATDGDVSGIVENMLNPGAVPPPVPAEAPAAPDLQELGVTAAVDGRSALNKARPAALADPVAEPGVGPGAWSPEVTARHPKLVAETMAELAGSAEALVSDPIDPSDPDAMAKAQQAAWDAPVHQLHLRNAAIALNFERLTKGIGKAVQASPSVQAAYAEAVEGAQAQTGTEAAPAEAAPAPEPAATTTRRTSSSSTTTAPSTS